MLRSRTGASITAATLLSALLPGLGQLYNNERGKGIALLLTATTVLAALLWSTVGPSDSRSLLTSVLLLPVYLLLWVPAVRDARERAKGAGRTFLNDAGPWYVGVMLAAVGPFALPLLWQSGRFTRAAKIWLTVAVVAVAVVAVLFIVLVGAWLDGHLGP